ncbi:MAG: hypothetical protein DWQ04_30050, partial [Chloroflexi bacterium]
AVSDNRSYERLPGGERGNSTNTFKNTADFVLNDTPNPQNSGSPMTPFPDDTLAIYIEAPTNIAPAEIFEYQIIVENRASVDAEDVFVGVPVSDAFNVLALPDGAVIKNSRIEFVISTIGVGESVTAVAQIESPATYLDTIIGGYYAESDNLLRAYGPLQMLTMSGGSIPIATARTLEGNTVSVEGVAVMYTGGFYAGSTSTKFYIEDESGGVQVYVPGGIDDVAISIGDRVQVTGEVTYYRDTVEVVPNDFVSDIEVVEQGAEWEPTAIAIDDYKVDDDVIGRLTTIAGTAVRIEEFTYSYEMDIADETGNIITLYIDKLTGISTEIYDVGSQYSVTGISEFYSGRYQIYPRVQDDIQQVFPPELLVSQSGPLSVLPGEEVVFEITAVNHTDSLLTNVVITAVSPASTEISTISEGGEIQNNDGTVGMTWMVPELAANGGEVVLQYTVTPVAGVQMIEALPAVGSADEWVEQVYSAGYRTFIGESGVPIWAIQGDGFRSPYVNKDATTQGIVTGVFPEMNGFWLQEFETDDNVATSAGVFVLIDEFEIPVAAGDFIQISGRVRELSGQTTLYPNTTEQISIISSENELPQSVAYDPPENIDEAQTYKESLEGMLVEIADPALVIAPTTQYGEYVLVRDKWGVDTVARTEDVGYLMYVDDGSTMRHEDQSTMAYAVVKGNVVEGVVGPLAFTFDNYKIESIVQPQIYGEVMNLPTLPEVGPNQFSVVTFNVENMFDNRDPHPSSPERPSRSQYAHRLLKLADAIQRLGAPTIVGLQEVENIDVLEALLELEEMAAYGYEPYLIEGYDSRGIDVAYLVRSEQATVGLVTIEGAGEELFNRPPLLLQATIHLDSGDPTVYLLNNHFLSLSGGEEATEPVRSAQAAWNAERMTQILADDPDAHFVVLGDLNSFYQTLPLDTLQDAGLRHAYDFVEDGPVPYTYIYEGRTQSLDHILMTDGLFSQLISVQTLPINADYPMAMPDDVSARRLSDHDPLIVVFEWE